MTHFLILCRLWPYSRLNHFQLWKAPWWNFAWRIICSSLAHCVMCDENRKTPCICYHRWNMAPWFRASYHSCWHRHSAACGKVCSQAVVWSLSSFVYISILRATFGDDNIAQTASRRFKLALSSLARGEAYFHSITHSACQHLLFDETASHLNASSEAITSFMSSVIIWYNNKQSTMFIFIPNWRS